MLKNMLKKFWREWGIPFLIVISILVPLRSAIADYNYIPSGSMQPTLLIGDNVLVNKLAYDLKVPLTTFHIAEWSNPEKGEVVVFFGPKDRIRMVKRVVGTPGDRIEMRNNRLLINGKMLDYEPSLPEKDLAPADREHCEFSYEALSKTPHTIMKMPLAFSVKDFGPIEVPAGKYFLLGDCRDNSNDSRFWGFVERSDIVGRVEMVLWSKPAWQIALPLVNRLFRRVI